MSVTVISVFGSGRASAESPAYRAAHDIGAAIAAAGWQLCNGGYGGTMEASARGAAEAGGHTIGVTCRVFGRSGPNPYIRQEVPTFDLHARLDILVRLAAGYVVLPGGTGTLLELALIWELFNKRLMEGPRPIVVLGEHWLPILAPIREEQPDALDLHVARDATEVVQHLRRELGAGGGLAADN